MSARVCPMCGGTDTVYAAFSGGREMFCPACEDNYSIPGDSGDAPRAVLLRTPAGRVALRAQMDQDLARLRDA